MSNNLHLVFSFIILLGVLACNKEISTTQPNDFGSGRIIIDSNPQGAQIFLNNENTGKITPDSLFDLKTGNYNLLLRMDPFLDTSFVIQLGENSMEFLYYDFYSNPLNYGAIVCSSEPDGATIFINDSSTGLTTPQTIQFLDPGNYDIKVTFPEHRSDSSFVILHASEVKQLDFSLQDTSVWVDYHALNSGFPSKNCVTSLAIDQNNVKWITTSDRGLISYDDKNWTIYNRINSELPSDFALCVEVDDQNSKWIGTSQGLAVFDDISWTTYTKDNSEIPFDRISVIAFDSDNNAWLGDEDACRLVKFDGFSWSSFYMDSPLTIEFDNDNMIWIGTPISLIIFDGFNTANNIDYTDVESEFFYRYMHSIKNDGNGNMWIAARGVSPFEGGVFIHDGNDFNKLDLPVGFNLYDICFSQTGDSWISVLSILGSSEGGGCLLKIDQSFGVTSYDTNDPINLTCHPFDIELDRYDNMWIATTGNGVVKLKLNKLQ